MNRIRIIRSVLPSAKISCPVPLREQAISKAEECFFTMLMQENEKHHGIHVNKIKECLNALFPGIKVKIIRNINKDSGGEEGILINQKGQVRGFELRLEGLKNKFCKLNNEEINNYMHEFNHLACDIFNPSFTASQYSINRACIPKDAPSNKLIRTLNKRIRDTDIIYENTVYATKVNEKEYERFCKKYQAGGKIKEEAIESKIKNIKQKYLKAINKLTPMVENEKIKILKMHIRNLESEQRAYTKGDHYYARAVYDKFQNEYLNSNFFNEDFINFRNSMLQENHMDYLFPEKIQMLKELYFEEVAKSRAQHKIKLNNLNAS